MDIKNETIEIQVGYFNYLLGINILKNLFENNLIKDINLNYIFCDYLSKKYIKSEEYKNCNVSYEESLKTWIKSRDEFIKSLYYFFISKKLINKEITMNDITERYNEFIKDNNKLDNNILYNGNLKILEVGESNNQKVVLIEKNNNGIKEYLVAYDYRIENNNLTWNKAYFYSTNQERAKLDFKNLINKSDVYNLFELKQDIGAIN